MSRYLELSRAIACGEGADRRHGDECQWDSRYRTRIAHQHQYRHDRTQKKASDLHQVNHAVLQTVNPEHITVEMCRSEALDSWRGLTSELDAMWSFVQRTAHPRWLWHAIDHHTGTVLG
jgi:hypothetical protein